MSHFAFNLISQPYAEIPFNEITQTLHVVSKYPCYFTSCFCLHFWISFAPKYCLHDLSYVECLLDAFSPIHTDRTL